MFIYSLSSELRGLCVPEHRRGKKSLVGKLHCNALCFDVSSLYMGLCVRLIDICVCLCGYRRPSFLNDGRHEKNDRKEIMAYLTLWSACLEVIE